MPQSRYLDLSAAEEIGEGAFIYNRALTTVKLNAEGSVIGNNAFARFLR